MYITRENMSADAFPLTSSTPAGFTGDPTNPNPNHHHQQQQPAQVKKNRKLPGTPDPEAEVIAMSPRALMATNRFVCEICNKGFQRDQNLQLHRRGHNLPWKLKQRTGKEVVRKRVYVCPEKTCIHHDPARALGDLTGIKKHFYRKHGEKKWKCDKCSKKYAVHSDWKAHSKVCGTREYKCDCGTIFSRKDSFITHRAFCDALTEEGARLSTATAVVSGLAFKSSPLMAHDVGGGGGNPYLGLGQDLLPGSIPQLHPLMRHPYASGAAASQDHGTNLSLWLHNNKAASGPHLNPDMDMPTAPDYLAPTSSMGLPELFQMPSAQVMGYGGCPLLPQQGGGANLSLSNPHSTYGFGEEEEKKAQLREASPGSFYSCSGLQATPQQENSTAHMSATALLQKAARMGATSSHHSSSSSSSFLTGTGFGGLIMSSANSLHPPLMENKDEFRLLLDQKQSAGNFHQDHLLTNTLATTGATLGSGENMAPAANISGMMTGVAAAGREPQLLLPNTWPHQVGRGPTRDFLGVGGEETTRPFLQQELAKFASMDSGMHLMSASYNSSRR